MECSYKMSWNGSKEEINKQAEVRDRVKFSSSLGDELNYREFKLSGKQIPNPKICKGERERAELSEKPGLAHKEEMWTTWNAQHGIGHTGMDLGIGKGCPGRWRSCHP